jgi:hypothetical protein
MVHLCRSKGEKARRRSTRAIEEVEQQKMITVVAAGCLAGSVAAAALSELGERIAVQLLWPRRFVWIASVAISLALSAGLIGQSVGFVGSQFVSFEKSNLVVADMGITLLWPAVSVVGAIQLLSSWRTLHRAARQWKPTIIENTQVWIADLYGPGTFGLREPRIVLPRWLLRSRGRPLRLYWLTSDSMWILEITCGAWLSILCIARCPGTLASSGSYGD